MKREKTEIGGTELEVSDRHLTRIFIGRSLKMCYQVIVGKRLLYRGRG